MKETETLTQISKLKLWPRPPKQTDRQINILQLRKNKEHIFNATYYIIIRDKSSLCVVSVQWAVVSSSGVPGTVQVIAHQTDEIQGTGGHRKLRHSSSRTTN